MVVSDHFDLMLAPPHLGHLGGIGIFGMIMGKSFSLLDVVDFESRSGRSVGMKMQW